MGYTMLAALRRRFGATESGKVIDPNLRGHIPALDGIRGMAILVVLIHHSFYTKQLDSLPLKVFERLCSGGWVGVDLFFVLSGFLITGILCDAKRKEHFFAKFYVRRVLRIIPLYYAAVALMLVAFPHIFKAQGQASAIANDKQVWYWTHLINYAMVFDLKGWPPYGTGHFWSLAVEEQFYLVWPVLIFVLSRKKALHLCMTLIVLGPIYRALWLYLIPPHTFMGTPIGNYVANYVFLPGRMDTLAIGAAIALAARERGGLIPFLMPARLLLPFGSLVLAAIALMHGADLNWSDGMTQIIGYSALGLTCGSLLVIGSVSAPTTLLGRILQSGVLRFLGRYSYSTYIFHVPILLWLHERWFGAADSIVIVGSPLLGQFAFSLVGSAISVAFAVFTWYAFEVHFLKLKRCFEYGHSKRAVSE